MKNVDTTPNIIRTTFNFDLCINRSCQAPTPKQCITWNAKEKKKHKRQITGLSSFDVRRIFLLKRLFLFEYLIRVERRFGRRFLAGNRSSPNSRVDEQVTDGYNYERK